MKVSFPLISISSKVSKLSATKEGQTTAIFFFPLPGNVIEEPLEGIVKRAKENKLLFEVNKRGHLGISDYFKISKRDTTEMIEEYGECGFCAKIYHERKDDILETIGV